jgi:hypothetical protein
MTIRSTLVAGAALMALAAASPAAAVEFLFDLGVSPSQTGSSFSWTDDGVTVTGTGYTYAGSVAAFQTFLATSPTEAALNALLTATQVRAVGDGIGVCSEGNGGECPHVDTGGTNEVIKFNISPAGTGYELTSAIFSQVNTRNPDDTLQVFGVTTGGVVNYLGYGGSFGGGFTFNAAPGFNNSAPTITALTGDNRQVTFDLTGMYRTYYFSTNGEDQGLRVASLTLNDGLAVPEPATWTMMILGFGGVGALIRRRRSTPALVRVTA